MDAGKDRISILCVTGNIACRRNDDVEKEYAPSIFFDIGRNGAVACRGSAINEGSLDGWMTVNLDALPRDQLGRIFRRCICPDGVVKFIGYIRHVFRRGKAHQNERCIPIETLCDKRTSCVGLLTVLLYL